MDFPVDPRKFTVDTSKPENYKSFIEGLRTHLGGISKRYSHNRPVLPLPVDTTIDIELRTKDRVITLRFRLNDLYLIGYQMENKKWLEFGKTNSKLIPNSEALKFDGDYNSLARAAGRSTIEGMQLGRYELINAVNQLATKKEGNLRAHSLIVVIQMICESIRFFPISDRLTRKFLPDPKNPNDTVGFRIVAWMLSLERSWGDLSKALLKADADPKQSFQLPPNVIIKIPFDHTKDDISDHTPTYTITTLEEAVNALGILLGKIYKRSALATAPYMALSALATVPYMAVSDDLGRPLVEVFSVSINHIDRENPDKLYGTITVTDGLGLQYIYNRGKENPESIKPGNNALLTGPARFISAYGSFNINVLLKDKDDEEVSNGEIWWNVYNNNNEYDKPLFHNVDGRYGSVTVNYIVLSDAVAASVQVTLIKRDGKNPADVYGQLTATNDNFGDCKSALFQKASNEHIKVSPGQLIPLSRSTIAVPLNSSFVVKANLYDHDVGSSDVEIVNDTAEFPAQPSGTVEKSIFGKDGEIRVKVTWILYY